MRRRAARPLRRAFLVTLGAGWTGYGAIGILADPRYGTSRGLADVTRYVPMDVLGWLWVAAGAVAVTAGLLAHCPRVQAAGFAALAAPACLWGAAFTLSAFTSYPQAAGSACAWVAFAVGIYWVSGMDDPLPEHLRRRV